MKNFFKRIMFMFVMLFGLTGLVACGEKPTDPPPTEQGTGGTGSGAETGTGTGSGSGAGSDTSSDAGTGSGSSSTQPSTEDQTYALVNANAKKLINEASADYEAVTNGEMVMAGEFNTAEFLSKNATFIEAMGGAESPAVQGMIEQMASMAEDLSEDVKSKTIEGYKGTTKEGYYERHAYDASQEKFNIQESMHTIKDANNLINYEFTNYGSVLKTKKYIGEDWATYAYLNNDNSFLSSAGIIELANSQTFAAYKSCLFDLMKKSIPMTIEGDVEDYATVTSTFTNDNGYYVLKNHVVLDKLPGDQYGLKMELVGTSDMDIYFTADKISKVVLDFDVESLSILEMTQGGSTIQIPFDTTIKSNMEIIVNNFNTTSSANADYLSAFVGTGADQDLDGKPDIEKTEGGYRYYLSDFTGKNNVTDFGEEIDPETASEVANDILEKNYDDIKDYYDTENLVWYTDYECTKVAADELINKTIAPSYVIDLYTKVPLKSNIVRINLTATDGEDLGRSTTLYLEVPTGEDSLTVNIENIKNEYLFSDTAFGLASNSVIGAIAVGDEILSGSSFEIEGGNECELTFLMSKFSLVEDNEVCYIIEVMTESEFIKYQAGQFYERQYTEGMATITGYDPADQSTHSLSFVISTLFEELQVDATDATAIYVDEVEVSGVSETITSDGGSTVVIMVVLPDAQ